MLMLNFEVSWLDWGTLVKKWPTGSQWTEMEMEYSVIMGEGSLVVVPE
jgi:hypothetical protein